MIALKMASSKADLEAIGSDFNAYILSNSFGAKNGQAAFSMDPALVGKNHVETALRLRTFLQTSRDKALAPLGPKFVGHGLHATGAAPPSLAARSSLAPNSLPPGSGWLVQEAGNARQSLEQGDPNEHGPDPQQRLSLRRKGEDQDVGSDCL